MEMSIYGMYISIGSLRNTVMAGNTSDVHENTMCQCVLCYKIYSIMFQTLKRSERSIRYKKNCELI